MSNDVTIPSNLVDKLYSSLQKYLITAEVEDFKPQLQIETCHTCAVQIVRRNANTPRMERSSVARAREVAAKLRESSDSRAKADNSK